MSWRQFNALPGIGAENRVESSGVMKREVRSHDAPNSRGSREWQRCVSWSQSYYCRATVTPNSLGYENYRTCYTALV
jgi:hypothetical protein